MLFHIVYSYLKVGALIIALIGFALVGNCVGEFLHEYVGN